MIKLFILFLYALLLIQAIDIIISKRKKKIVIGTLYNSILCLINIMVGTIGMMIIIQWKKYEEYDQVLSNLPIAYKIFGIIGVVLTLCYGIYVHVKTNEYIEN